VIYALGLTTGYAAWPLPGLRQAVNNSDQKMADEQSKILIE
jgi:N-acetylated-alpha-linked acidic dipeptidase